MAHDAFTKPSTATSAAKWEELAIKAEKDGQIKLAILYWNNVVKTALGAGRANRARENIKRLSA